MTAKLNQTIKYVFLTTDAIISAASEMGHTIDIMKLNAFKDVHLIQVRAFTAAKDCIHAQLTFTSIEGL